MPSEVTGAAAFIYARLAADATLVALLSRPKAGTTTPQVLNLYRDQAPQEATYPLVIIRYLSGVDRNAMPVTVRMLTNMLFLVEAYTNVLNTIVLDQIADRVDDLLNGASGTVAAHGIRVHGLYRQQATFLQETEADRTYYRLGGEYRTMISRL